MLDALSFTFMQNALAAGVLVSVACGIIGALVVVNKTAFIAGAVAHGAYGGIGIAFFAGFSPLLGAAGFAVALGVLIAWVGLRDKERTDGVIGAIWAFGMAVGVVFVDLTPGYGADLMSYLFGSILAVSRADLIFTGLIDIVIIAFVAVLYPQICAASFDSEFASLRGVKTSAIYYVTTILTALCVVVTIRMVGLVLVIALLTIPPYLAEKFSKNLAMMMSLGAVISCVFCTAGLFLSYKLNLTGGAAIILVATTCFFALNLRKSRANG